MLSSSRRTVKIMRKRTAYGILVAATCLGSCGQSGNGPSHAEATGGTPSVVGGQAGTGGSTNSGSATGGSANAGSATGGSANAGSATGGSPNGGSAIGGGSAGTSGSPAFGGQTFGPDGCPVVPALKLTKAATLTQTAMLLVQAPGDPRLFVAERLGRILLVTGGVVSPTPFLDIRSSVAPLETERGLLSIALHPQFAANRRFYVAYTRITNDPLTPNQTHLGDVVLAEGTASMTDPNRADPTLKILLTVPKNNRFHNGGMLAFGPDGMLYMSSGEDGRSYDKNLKGSLQELTNMAGKILRINVDDPAARPAGNFANGDVHVWDYGLRNPWRMSFDRKTGDLYIGDVGEITWEELIFEPKGVGQKNYGWPRTEGNHCYLSSNCDMTGITPAMLELGHTGEGSVNGSCGFDDMKVVDCNRAVLGGYVYRGQALPELDGRYFYGENIHNEVRSLVVKDGKATCQADHTKDLVSNTTRIQGLVSFSEDAQGELYLLDIFANVYRLERR
jgi:glucose/arabinose dehydrogenase